MEFQRLELLIGNEKLSKLRSSNILILGLGGVGSYVVTSLARCGINKITIVDYDTIDITNINRQTMAYHSNIGMKKTKVLKDIIIDINQECKVTIIDNFIDENNINLLFNDNYDYIIDCCDSLNTKKALIKECLERNIKLISSMGTANKLDPTKFTITDIRKTANDPIAKILRKWVKDERINKKIIVLCSLEQPIKQKSLGSNSIVPSTAGLLIADYVFKELIK